ncbi:10402_t:CDS:2 [Acaulospora morrowiae]|uniref:10402_t:CDS:1 n=1 Tax=Acaulospora morrowiae TaxID=94023 RepID=A0A9N8ZLB9_9GLOM|nr:10402_t:CDS:2 [Acaulospora morrowiae]
MSRCIRILSQTAMYLQSHKHSHRETTSKYCSPRYYSPKAKPASILLPDSNLPDAKFAKYEFYEKKNSSLSKQQTQKSTRNYQSFDYTSTFRIVVIY